MPSYRSMPAVSYSVIYMDGEKKIDGEIHEEKNLLKFYKASTNRVVMGQYCFEDYYVI